MHIRTSLQEVKKGFETFDNNWFQNDSHDLKDNLCPGTFWCKYLGKTDNIGPITYIRIQRWINLWIKRLSHKIIHFTQFLWQGIELGRMASDARDCIKPWPRFVFVSTTPHGISQKTFKYGYNKFDIRHSLIAARYGGNYCC